MGLPFEEIDIFPDMIQLPDSEGLKMVNADSHCAN